MIGVEDDSEGGEDKQSGRSRKPRKCRSKKMGGREVVGRVSNGCRTSLWVRVRVRTEPLPNWRFG
jgi:hypothetical protein